MQFTVPQFIEHEPKIFGPLTFKQAIYVGSAIALSFIFYFLVGKNNFLLFVMVAAILFLAAGALAFMKVNGRSLPAVFLNIIAFSTTQKIYLWKKKEVAPKLIKRVLKKEVANEDASSSLKFAEKSRLKNLSNQIETKI